MYMSFVQEFADRLRQNMRLSEGTTRNPYGGANEYELERVLDLDMLVTSVGWGSSHHGETDEYVDEWGVHWRASVYQTPYGVGTYRNMIEHPLAEPGAIDQYAPPDPTRPALYARAEQIVRNYRDEYWIVGATLPTIFECAWALRGLENLLIDMVTEPSLAERILDIPYGYHLTAAKRLVEIGVDMVWIGDDVGGQAGMIMSPRLWRRFLKPRLAAFISELKAINPAVKVAYHSDGNIRAIIPELIEVGVDVLNPVQPACLDLAELKREFGHTLCFWGGVDVQRTLPFEASAVVREEVRMTLEVLGASGGLIIAPTHHVQLDTPLENFWAMMDVIRTKNGSFS
jgi:uroporphyrinogen decarboxylase